MDLSFWALAGAILSSSFIGSWHCAAMCGPLALARRDKPVAYHLGRGFAYVSAGFVCGYLSEKIFLRTPLWVQITFAVVMGILILATLFSSKLAKGLFRPPRILLSSSSYFLSGAASLLLPCGWLWTYLSAAAVTGSSRSGALVMALFWLGGLPALSAVQLYFHSSLRRSPPWMQVFGERLVAVASLYALVAHFLPH